MCFARQTNFYPHGFGKKILVIFICYICNSSGWLSVKLDICAKLDQLVLSTSKGDRHVIPVYVED